MSKIRVPQNAKKTPRCPLCFARFDRKVIPSREEGMKQMFAAARRRYQEAVTPQEKQKAKDHGELLEQAIKQGAAEAFFCHFCRISIMCNDPFVGQWEAAYAQGEKLLCPVPSCETEMRFFCTSTGYMLAQCPKKKCRSRMELSSPDRAKEDHEQLVDERGNPIALPGVNNPISTPSQLSIGQAGEAKLEEGLEVTDVRIVRPPTELKQ